MINTDIITTLPSKYHPRESRPPSSGGQCKSAGFLLPTEKTV